nr:hypothetical protein HK105_000362 [Polyrhizophydium stewartii]
MDTTLKELMALLLAQDGSLCNSHTRMNMRIVDRASHMDGNFVARPLGVVGTTLEWPDAVITLASAKFSIGDFIIVTTSDGPALPASAEPRGRSDKSGFGPTRGRDRERSSRYDPYSRGQRRSEADGRWARAEPAPR